MLGEPKTLSALNSNGFSRVFQALNVHLKCFPVCFLKQSTVSHLQGRKQRLGEELKDSTALFSCFRHMN